MSDTGRDAHHRQERRDASSHITITLPYTDDEPGQSISVLEDLFLGIIPEGAECAECGPQQELDEACLPASLANGCLGDHAATDALGRMTVYTTHCHRHGLAVQPVAPDGRSELMPLYFFRLPRTDHVQLTSALADLPQVEDLIVRNYTGSHDAAGQLLARAQRLRAFLDLPWDDDVDLLDALLDRAPPDLPWDDDRESWCKRLIGPSIFGPTERLVLTHDEHAAYQRATERILATWQGTR
ncbi:MAG: hypothetical protein KY439_01610 [Actinobacteria bacterium]|nr:hypothetical protein [Actinomycetota bacterium]